MGDVKRDDAGGETRVPRRYLPDLLNASIKLTGFKNGLPELELRLPNSEGAAEGVLTKMFLLVASSIGDLGSAFRGSRLHHPPGYALLWFADFFYSKKSVEECLRPTIQDLQDEYAEALASKRLKKARWVRIRGTWSFACAAGMLTMGSIGKHIIKIWKAVG